MNEYSMLTVYSYAKEYYVFYFPSTHPAYYAADETKRRHELIAHKHKSPIFQRWRSLLKTLNTKLHHLTIMDANSNAPCFYCKMAWNNTSEKQVNAYLSVSLIGPFYSLFIEEKGIYGTKIFVSPDGGYEKEFEQCIALFESSFPEYVFCCGSLIITARFFGLIDYTRQKPMTMFQGLFFDFDFKNDNIAIAGNRRYHDKAILAIQQDIDTNENEINAMKNMLSQSVVDYREI